MGKRRKCPALAIISFSIEDLTKRKTQNFTKTFEQNYQIFLFLTFYQRNQMIGYDGRKPDIRIFRWEPEIRNQQSVVKRNK